MKVSYTGIKSGLPAKLQEKLDTKFAKLSKLVDGRGEKQAHVVVTSERHLHKAEITLHVHNHQLVGIGSDSDVFKAMAPRSTGSKSRRPRKAPSGAGQSAGRIRSKWLARKRLSGVHRSRRHPARLRRGKPPRE